ncbi:hypothetical protein ACSTK0_25170, partial [Vibrio parahaemolyticus]
AGAGPQSGWWWNAAEPGRGYFLESQYSAAGDQTIYAGYYMYDDAGNAVWYYSQMPVIASGGSGTARTATAVAANVCR